MSATIRGGALRQVDFMVLTVLLDGPRHGYGIVQAVAELTGGGVDMRPGDVYRVLYRMHRGGLIAPIVDGADGADDRRTMYGVTDHGRRVAEQQAAMMAEVSAAALSRLDVGR